MMLENMKARLGIYNKKPYKQEGDNGISDQSLHLRTAGGHLPQERMIRDKRRSFDRAVWSSYQAAEITHVGENKPARALINPDRLSIDYDDKVLSVGFEHDYKPGDVFEWIGTHSYWLVYLQDLNELAYFRGSIRRCDYQIEVDKDKKVYIALKGPNQKTLDTSLEHGIRVDSPNYTLEFMVSKTEENLKLFQRYYKFMLNGLCWEVQATDSITVPDIIEVYAKEYYKNDFEDTDEFVGGLVEPVVDPNTDEAIIGETFIKPRIEYTYSCEAGEGEWSVDKKCPVKLTVVSPTKVKVKWDSSYSGQFELSFGEHKKIIVVESLF